jgi:hypothetical protein
MVLEAGKPKSMVPVSDEGFLLYQNTVEEGLTWQDSPHMHNSPLQQDHSLNNPWIHSSTHESWSPSKVLPLNTTEFPTCETWRHIQTITPLTSLGSSSLVCKMSWLYLPPRTGVAQTEQDGLRSVWKRGRRSNSVVVTTVNSHQVLWQKPKKTLI